MRQVHDRPLPHRSGGHPLRPGGHGAHEPGHRRWKAKEHIDFSLYGTPLESTTYKFAKCLQKRFGVIPGITDKSYITNSYHVHVTEEIDAFSKLSFEAQFQALSPGGAISYVEVPDMQQNLEPCSRSWASSTTTSCTPS